MWGSNRKLDENALIIRSLVKGVFPWLPVAERYETEFQIPVLPFVSSNSLPSESMPFDHLKGAASTTLANFHVADAKLLRLLNHPASYAAYFTKCWGVTSPDFSIMSTREPQFRVIATWLNRTIGLVWAQRDIRVIPMIRWANSLDYCHAFAGVEKGSVVAISSHGHWRNDELREGFLLGLPHLVDQIQPEVVVLHGSDNKLVRAGLGRGVEVLPLATNPHYRQRIA
jgi:hypothetical protein